jgi:uncharacterized membrane protein YiaA
MVTVSRLHTRTTLVESTCGIQLLENMMLIFFGISNAGVASDPMNIVNIAYNNLAKELDGDSIRVHR